MTHRLQLTIGFGFFYVSLVAQLLQISSDLKVDSWTSKDGMVIPFAGQPLVSYEIGERYYESGDPQSPVRILWVPGTTPYEVQIINNSRDTLAVKNILPFGKRPDHIYITGSGNHPLSRTHLYLPGFSPVNIIVPDNAWNLGYTSVSLAPGYTIYALTRRKSLDNGVRRRFETVLYPGGSVVYNFFIDTFSGEWQNGLRACFRDKKLYDLPVFDDSMYNRSDLRWIRSVKMIHLIMGWDSQLYDRKQNQYVLGDFIQRGKSWYGGDDAIGIWPTWPALGIDQRNQWDMFRDMPGGLVALRKLSDECHASGVRFFICYNPWDESTRKEDHLQGMAELVKALDADGVVLDTRGSSSKELQAAVDQIKPGVIMYSEGMAVPADMETIIAGRVHNALYYPPILNLNKLIQPPFAIFRVTEIYKEPIRREIHSSLFNGYGIEFNLFHPGNPDGQEDQYKYLGRCLNVLREHSALFNSREWTPLYPSLQDSIWINHWYTKNKDVFTIYNSLSRGFDGELFKVMAKPGRWIDLWNHKPIDIKSVIDGHAIPVRLDPYPGVFQNTNNEGSIGVIARFEPQLRITMIAVDQAAVSAANGSHILIWAGLPGYQNTPLRLSRNPQTINLTSVFPGYEGDFVFQLFDSLELIDEEIISLSSAMPRPISSLNRTTRHDLSPEMVVIPADTFRFFTTHGDEFIPYPDDREGVLHQMPSYFMDRHPVTNKEFETFLKKSGYKPKNKINFLKHWNLKKIPSGMEHHPVVYISIEDVNAYCKWSGKRLPTELEWQYAAQTPKRYRWPWGNEAGITHTESEQITETLTHTRFSSFDSSRANPGNGHPDQVGSYPRGKNEYGLSDLVGSVWQMTTDRYQTGSYEYIMLKGGSYYKPTASWWYVQGGPQPLTWRQMLLLVDQGFERKSTVGFRCVRDK
ncbi:MAG: SUMF1/EgtB/PvdO family nonheme iron enzyme [Saprospiraceae bacterium]|nr:SUMF1/EgtB/PvdO family nonheme iron enzyme [Saprospiraceae bacterium]